jgi:hypothetical protein
LAGRVRKRIREGVVRWGASYAPVARRSIVPKERLHDYLIFLEEQAGSLEAGSFEEIRQKFDLMSIETSGHIQERNDTQESDDF